MDADHVTPWSVGGETTEENLTMLCGYHNKLKGNR
ncbi:HNH endonuclease [Corynebacterium faecium]|nr:HNH endonuclease [Corynebacterium faecium]